MTRAGIPACRCRPARFAGRATARLLLVATLAVAACSTTRVVSDYDHSARFSSLHSFTVVTRARTSTIEALAEQRTYEAIRAELTSKGFVYVLDPAEADFAVDFAIEANDRLEVRSYPSPYGGSWSHAGWSGNQADVDQYQQGTLAIDVLHARSHTVLWHGSARKNLSQSDIASSQLVIRDAVTAVLVNFPPKEP